MHIIMSNQPYISFQQIGCSWCYIILIMPPLCAVAADHRRCGVRLPETATPDCRSPVICPVVTPYLQCAGYGNQAKSPTPQVLLCFFMRILIFPKINYYQFLLKRQKQDSHFELKLYSHLYRIIYNILTIICI